MLYALSVEAGGVVENFLLVVSGEFADGLEDCLFHGHGIDWLQYRAFWLNRHRHVLVAILSVPTSCTALRLELAATC